MCRSDICHHKKNESGSARLWTFAETRANRSIAKKLQSAAEVSRVDALGIDLKSPLNPKLMNDDFLASELQFSSDEIKERSKPIKFADCLPDALLKRHAGTSKDIRGQNGDT